MNSTPVDTYNQAPVVFWFTSKEDPDDFYMTSWYHGTRYIGYLHMPDYSQIEKWDLRLKGLGDIDWLLGKS